MKYPPRSCKVLNQQKRINVDLNAARLFVHRVKAALRLGRRDFSVSFVGDARIAELNGKYRGKPKPTDVLSFPWDRTRKGSTLPGAVRGRRGRVVEPRYSREFAGFLGDIVISAETARRNARAAGHSLAREVRWLIIHGVLHLLGYDHQTDRGEMTALELALRRRLGA